MASTSPASNPSIDTFETSPDPLPITTVLADAFEIAKKRIQIANNVKRRKFRTDIDFSVLTIDKDSCKLI